MAEALGSAAAILHIAEMLLKLSNAIQDARHAPKEMKLFKLETLNLGKVLNHFHDAAKKSLQGLDEPQRHEREDIIDGLVEQCSFVKRETKTLMDEISTSQDQDIDDSRLQRLVLRVRWYLRKTQVAGVRLSLESAKSTVSLFMSVLIIEDLTRKVAELQRNQQEVPRELTLKLELLTDLMKGEMNVAREARKETEEFLRRNEGLLDLPIKLGSIIREVDRTVEDLARVKIREQTGPRRRSHRPHRRKTRYSRVRGVSAERSAPQRSAEIPRRSFTGHRIGDDDEGVYGVVRERPSGNVHESRDIGYEQRNGDHERPTYIVPAPPEEDELLHPGQGNGERERPTYIIPVPPEETGIPHPEPTVSPQVPSEARPDNNDGPAPNHEEKGPPSRKDETSEEEIGGHWRAVAPFGTYEKRPRRPRPESPIP